MRFVRNDGHSVGVSISRVARACSTVLLASIVALPSLVVAQSGGVDAVTVGQAPVLPAEFNGDLSKLPPLAPFATVGAEPAYRPLLRGPRPLSKATVPGAAAPAATLPIGGPLVPMPSPLQNFAGMSFTDNYCTGAANCGGGWPPDPNGDVGPNHYIEAVNVSYAIYRKDGTRLAAFRENQLWSGASTGTPCDANGQGDPIVVYDRIADRWILTHFAFGFSAGKPVSPFYQCIAASKTSDPVTGGWWFYAIRMDPGTAGTPPVGNLNDYPKFGAWHDCLYMGTNEFLFDATHNGTYSGVAVASFSRSDMYSGSPVTYALGFLPYPANQVFGLFPSNNLGKGANAVSPGTPNYYVQESLSVFQFEVFKFTAGANCGGGGTFGSMTAVSQTQYNFTNLNSGVPEIPQPGTANNLDQIDDRLMQKVQYRRIGSMESVWVTHNVDPCTGGVGCPTHAPTGMQWAQIDVTGGTVAPTPVQEQIHAPDSILYRWMGSLAVDRQGNMALGYSTSNGAAPNYPSLAYAGRLATDPLGTLPQTEVQLIAGGGSQTINCGSPSAGKCDRWGDYSAMSVDPVDDCTFWYTNEYYSSQANGTSGNWQNRIGSFAFPSCLTSTARALVPDGSSEQQAFTSYPEARWFALPVEPGKTYVIEAADTNGDLAANAIGTLNVYGPDTVSAPAEASVSCTAANGPRPPAVDVNSDGIRCIVRTALPTAGMQQNKRPVYVKVTRMDPALGGGSQFRIRAREATVYGRWLTNSNYDYHVEVENTTADQMCVELALYPASGLTYTPGPGWAGVVSPTTLTVPAFGAVKTIFPHGTLVGPDSEGSLRIGSCGAPISLISAGLHVSTYAFDPVANTYIYYFTSTANEGKTRSTW